MKNMGCRRRLPLVAASGWLGLVLSGLPVRGFAPMPTTQRAPPPERPRTPSSHQFVARNIWESVQLPLGFGPPDEPHRALYNKQQLSSSTSSSSDIQGTTSIPCSSVNLVKSIVGRYVTVSAK